MNDRRTRVAVVTGANRGIGEAIARELGTQGFHVVPTAREPPPRDSHGRAGEGPSPRPERSDPGVGAFARLDVTRLESVAALARELRERGGIDVLVNNAAVSLDGFDAEVARRTLDANFFGAMRVTDALLPEMRDGARIVMVSSGMGTLTHVRGTLRGRFEDPELTRDGLVELMQSFVRDVADGVHTERSWPSSAYSVSKVGLNALVRVVARELAGDPRRILVNAADPGWVKTRMGGPSAPRTVDQGAQTPVWLAQLPDGGPSGGFFRDRKPATF
jgi:NAD(P)-dependent dehydrogenase (short-subunit alcohol dehydrogenase family)